MLASRAALAVAYVTAAAVPAQAPTTWQLRGGDAMARIVGPDSVQLRGPRARHQGLRAGDYTVHFGADAAGKPGSLSFAVPAGAGVWLATGPASAATLRNIEPVGSHWRDSGGAGSERMRTTGSLDESDYRITATVDAGTTTTPHGLVARWRSANEYYAFVVDRAVGELRLERKLGQAPLVLARAAWPDAPGGHCELALQVQGFRLQAFVDDRLVLQALDGGIAGGGYGTTWRGTTPSWNAITVGPPAASRASVALVRTGGAASLHAATAAVPGHFHVLELALDRPHPLLPYEPSGLEPWLLQRAAAPQVMLADWRGSLGLRGVDVVPRDGTIHCPVEWPALPALQGQVALVRLLLVTADGDTLAGATPAVPLNF
ncbi:MAG: hypothetical protein WAT39_24850 [Planctomycetota bacterium]